MVVFNTAGTNQMLPSRPTIYPAGTKLVNLLDPGETVTVLENSQTPPISVSGTSAKIFLARSQWLPLDPVVTHISPAHDSQSVGTTSPVVIGFSEAMDPASAEAAFSTVPAVPGTFSWSPAHDSLTFTPQSNGFPQLTLVKVRLAETARATGSGRIFYSAFESQFKTSSATSAP
jgi:hypothetical protein